MVKRAMHSILCTIVVQPEETYRVRLRMRGMQSSNGTTPSFVSAVLPAWSVVSTESFFVNFLDNFLPKTIV